MHKVVSLRLRAAACVLIVLAACSSTAPRARTTPTATPTRKTSTPATSRSPGPAGSLSRLPYVVERAAGAHARREILSTPDGGSFRVAAMLPRGLRYMAVAAAGSKILVVGGQTDSALGSRDVLLADPATGSVRVLASLPVATAHAVAVV